MPIVEDDRRRLDNLKHKLARLDDLTLTIGVHSDVPPHQDDGMAIGMAELAAIHEFGTSKIPERSFLRAGIALHEGDINERAAHAVGKLIDGAYAPDEVLEYVGELGLGDIRDFLTSGQVKQGLSATTIASREKKAGHGGGVAGLAGSHLALIDTGQLMGSLAFKVSDTPAEDR